MLRGCCVRLSTPEYLMDPRELKLRYQSLLDGYHSGTIDWQTFERGLFELKRIRAALASSENTDSSIIPESERSERMRRQAPSERPNRFAQKGNETGTESPTTRWRNLDTARLKSTTPTVASGCTESELPVGEGSGVLRSHSGILKTAARRLQIGAVLGGRYALQRSLGRGTFGDAWLAKDAESENYVVIKLIPFPIQYNSKPLEQFVRLFRRIVALKHPNICPFFFLDEDDKFGTFVVSAYLDAIPLDQYYSQYVQTFQAFPMLAVVRVLWPIAVALDHARNHKLFHGDLKPENVMIGKSCGAMLTDLRLAENVRTSLHELGISTAASDAGPWRAPEVWLDDRNGPLSDQYSLAALAYQLIAGTPPFTSRNESELREKIIYANPLPIKSESDSVNAALQKGLSKDPYERFPSCLHFVKALVAPTSTEHRKSIARLGLFPLLFGVPQPEKPTCLATDATQNLWPAEMEDVKSHDLNIPQHSVYPYPGTEMKTASATSSVFTWLTSTTLLSGLATIGVIGGILLSSANQAVPPFDDTPELETVLSSPDNRSSIADLEATRDLPTITADELGELGQLASRGDVDAQRTLGEYLFHGNRVPTDDAMAFDYFSQAAKKDDAKSLYYLGYCYQFGRGVEQDIGKAKIYYEQATRLGSAEAEAALRRINDF